MQLSKLKPPVKATEMCSQSGFCLLDDKLSLSLSLSMPLSSYMTPCVTNSNLHVPAVAQGERDVEMVTVGFHFPFISTFNLYIF